MKRVVMIAVIMAVITSLFAFSVYAAPTPGTSYSTNISSDDNNITAYAYAVYEEGVYQLSTQGLEVTSPSLLVSIRIVNNTNKWVIKDTDQFKFRISGIYAINYPFEFVDIVNCTISEVATASGRADLTIKGDNSFVLAPNETYVISFRMVVYDGFTTPVIQFFNNQFLNSDYNIEELVSLPADELAYLGSLNSDLNDLIDAVTFDGSYSAPGSGSYETYTYDVTDESNVRRFLRYVIYPSYLETYDFEVDASNDSTLEAGFKRYVIDVFGTITVPVNKRYTVFYFSSPVVTSTYYPYVVNTNSNLFESSYVYGSRIYPRNSFVVPEIPDQFMLPAGTSYFHILCYLDVPINVTPTFRDISTTNPYTISNFSNYTGSEYIQSSDQNVLSYIASRLRDIYQSLAKPSNQDNTEEAQEMNDDIHDAEQVWYDNNTEALEEVGLSNYRFSPSQSNGITQAVTQFQAVWNALGNWTNVYIFILILSISTYIIRHEPTTRVKQYRSSVQAERAERISYYGRKNAESRANSGSTLKSVIRRRK